MDALLLQQSPEMDVAGIIRHIMDVLPSIRARRQEIEQSRRMPRDLIDELSKTGVFRLGVPRDLGGEQARPAELMSAVELVATADGSAGWCTMIGLANSVSAGYMRAAGAREVFADPSAPGAGIAAPAGTAIRVDGGVRVSGRWSFASGITHCDWLWTGCIVTENGQPRMTPHGPEIIHVCMPVADVEIHDTWYVTGLSGTGSNDFSVRDVFVPEHRIFALLDTSGHRPEPLYQMPVVGFFACKLACVSLGIARSALDELGEVAQTKVPTMYTAVLADKAVVQVELARAEASFGAARTFLYRSIDDIWQALSAGGEPTPRQIAMARIAALHAAETAANVTRTANVLAGGSAIYTRTSLQRHARDAEVIMHHFTVAPHAWEEAGRVLLGRQPIVPAF